MKIFLTNTKQNSHCFLLSFKILLEVLVKSKVASPKSRSGKEWPLPPCSAQVFPALFVHPSHWSAVVVANCCHIVAFTSPVLFHTLRHTKIQRANITIKLERPTYVVRGLKLRFIASPVLLSHIFSSYQSCAEPPRVKFLTCLIIFKILPDWRKLEMEVILKLITSVSLPLWKCLQKQKFLEVICFKI